MFIRISVPILEAKKNLYWSMIGKVLLHVGKNQSKSKTLTNKFGLLQIQLRGLGAQPQGNFVTYTLIYA